MKLLRMTFITALRALQRNKLRSSLTMLGIVIGVAAVIAMVSIGQGADAAVQQQIRSLGIVRSVSCRESGLRTDHTATA